MPETVPFLHTAMLAETIAPTLQLRPQVLTRLSATRAFMLSDLRHLKVIGQVDNAPHVLSAPDGVERAVPGEDGIPYFVPQARVSVRSEATRAPHVFLERRDGEVLLQVWFDLVRFPSLPSESKPLPVLGHSVALVGSDGRRIEFERCDDLPAPENSPNVVSRLFCETKVDANSAIGLLQSPGTVFRVDGDVSFSMSQGGGGSSSGAGVLGPIHIDTVRLQPRGPLRVFSKPIDPRIAAGSLLASRARFSPMLSGAVLSDAVLSATIADAAQPAPPVTWATQTKRMPLGAADNGGVNGYYEPGLMENRAIYSQVTSGFGTEPWSEWVESPNGRFMDSPVPDQFYVLPDEYRLTFDAETKVPSMMVLLVPPKGGAEPAGPISFGGDYTLRTRFSVVPWIDPERRERLRAEIAKHSGRPYPILLVGGIRSATVSLSAVLHELGSSVVGAADAAAGVDPLGFDLVLDCTSEFYSTLSHMLVTDGVDATVTVTLISDAAEPPRVEVPTVLRLDRPASDVLRAELVPAEPVPEEPAVAAEPAPAGEPAGEPAAPASVVPEGQPDPLAAPPAPPRLRVINPLPYAVTVAQALPTLLVIDERTPSPLGAVRAQASPASFTLPAASADAPSSIELTLTPEGTDQPPVFGSVGVAFVGVDIDIDPAQVLAKAHDSGSAGSVSSAVNVRCYQLEHPDVLPAALADVFGLEVQLRRSETAAAITVFLTRDQPAADVQVAFTLGDIMAGAKPEQPTFEWRARNMAGSGTGEWSAWGAITGRQLFVSPNGV
ncbi:hypothetical protein [Microbacterium sp. SD291]|uniref:hypothetical protein n=1 Tax=Microbacterium sp. SD291 TaxID=2782007 RepID=UPI001A966393|nr:hypothetical protein [Microbacterium sp. SD291]MBO0981999.1 hypothetical protein [Microbacterium sp. SD291]